MNALYDVGNTVRSGKVPSRHDVCYGLGFLKMTVLGHVDSILSEKGQLQVLDAQLWATATNFIDDVDVIAHSPLQRARETCYGIFGLDVAENQGFVDHGTKATTSTSTNLRTDIPPVVQLNCLQEVTPFETVTGGKKAVRTRIKELERWIDQQDDAQRICLVGHSEYFQILLKHIGMDHKPKNCDVWRASYEPQNSKWSNLKLIHRLGQDGPITNIGSDNVGSLVN